MPDAAAGPQAAALSYAFALGLVAVANPCGLPLLPAYLSFFVDGQSGLARRTALAVTASACVTAGFVSCFGVIGLALGGAVSAVETAAPGVMIAVGVSMVVFGVVAVSGRYLPRVGRLPGLRVGDRRPLTMVAFGVFYAVASLSCSLPVFIAAVGGSVDRAGSWAVLRSSLAYALGMGLLLSGLAVSVAAGGGVPRLVRLSGRMGRPVAGVLLVASGSYLAYYWSVDLADPGSAPWLVRTVNSAQASLASWLNADARWLGLACVAVVVVVLVGAALTNGLYQERPREAGWADPPAPDAAAAPSRTRL